MTTLAISMVAVKCRTTSLGVMPGLNDDMSTRGAPLEYWFARLDTGDVSFLVDFIVRRRVGTAEIRVSAWIRGRGRVVRTVTRSWTATGANVTAGDAGTLTADGSRGRVDDIGWDLTWEVDADRVAPRAPLFSRLHAFDLELVSRPSARFAGHVTVGAERFDVSTATGSVTHYWGRRLPDRWHWISASTFASPAGHRHPDLAIEGVVNRSRLWGVPPGVATGYLWIRDGGRQRLLVSPLNAVITASGGPGRLLLTARSPGGTVRVECTASRDQYNDLGEGIAQTLLARCRLLDRDLSSQAGLEHRFRSST
jgi:hypothetical protein